MLEELARAKVNLCLHITGRRDDGMHLLDSIVVFPNVGDVLEVKSADDLTLKIDGPFGAGLDAGANNLVMQAARLLTNNGAALRLQKNLPLASGIGGGSADAAACIRLLSRLRRTKFPPMSQLIQLGADVPVCMDQTPKRMSGIGQELVSIPPLPEFWVVLVNAGHGVETGAVFKAMEVHDNRSILNIPASFKTQQGLFDFLRAQRNDMQEVAVNISPAIADVMAKISATKNCALTRMSGSGGTCFGLFATKREASAAASQIQHNQPDWWVVAADV